MMRAKIFYPILGVAVIGLLSACQALTPPKGVKPVTQFDLQRYQGRWFEIARLENRFEKGLTQVTATYLPQADGSVQVINRGFNPQRQSWSQSVGKAKFIGRSDNAALKVSFFGPFYASYNVIALDSSYQHALVCGPDRSYLWLLSRQPTIDQSTRRWLLEQAQQAGFNTQALLWTEQQQR